MEKTLTFIEIIARESAIFHFSSKLRKAVRYSESRNSILAIVLQLFNASFEKKKKTLTRIHFIPYRFQQHVFLERNPKITTLPRLLYLIVDTIMFL